MKSIFIPARPRGNNGKSAMELEIDIDAPWGTKHPRDIEHILKAQRIRPLVNVTGNPSRATNTWKHEPFTPGRRNVGQPRQRKTRARCRQLPRH